LQLGRRSTASVAGSLGSAGSLLSAIYNHHLVISPDHSQVSFEGWGLLFTAYLMLIVDGLGCWIGVLALRTIQHQRRRYEFLSMILTTIVPYCSGSRTPMNA